MAERPDRRQPRRWYHPARLGKSVLAGSIVAGAALSIAAMINMLHQVH